MFRKLSNSILKIFKSIYIWKLLTQNFKNNCFYFYWETTMRLATSRHARCFFFKKSAKCYWRRGPRARELATRHGSWLFSNSLCWRHVTRTISRGYQNKLSSSWAKHLPEQRRERWNDAVTRNNMPRGGEIPSQGEAS